MTRDERVQGGVCARPRARYAHHAPAGAIRVTGPTTLAGEVRPHGFKHSAVTAISAGLLAQGVLQIENCPDHEETRVLAHLIRLLGGVAIQDEDSLRISGASVGEPAIDAEGASRIHGGIYLVPGILARLGQVRLSAVGGCRIGDGRDGFRPLEHYVDVLHRFGASAEVAADGDIVASIGEFHAATIDIMKYSTTRGRLTGPMTSGATKFALLLAAVSRGTSEIVHPYFKPDVTQLVESLQALGFDIETYSRERLVVTGSPALPPPRTARVRLINDLIEIMTYVCAGLMHGDRVVVTGLTERDLSALQPELGALELMNAPVRLTGSSWDAAIEVTRSPQLRAANIDFLPDGVFSDCQPLFALLASYAAGVSTLTDHVWPARFSHIEGLRQLGVNAWAHENGRAVVAGPSPPSRAGSTVVGRDLRAAATLVLAGLAPAGSTLVLGTEHLTRGYADLPGQLQRLGARLEPVRSDSTLGHRA